jgi:hypothetical protein
LGGAGVQSKPYLQKGANRRAAWKGGAAKRDITGGNKLKYGEDKASLNTTREQQNLS